MDISRILPNKDRRLLLETGVDFIDRNRLLAEGNILTVAGVARRQFVRSLLPLFDSNDLSVTILNRDEDRETVRSLLSHKGWEGVKDGIIGRRIRFSLHHFLMTEDWSTSKTPIVILNLEGMQGADLISAWNKVYPYIMSAVRGGVLVVVLIDRPDKDLLKESSHFLTLGTPKDKNSIETRYTCDKAYNGVVVEKGDISFHNFMF